MTTLQAALSYALRGWHVLPIRPGTKIPLTEHGVHDATSDPARINRWWSTCPAAGLGISCGPSRLLVVDLDGPRAVEAWRAMLATQEPPRPTATVATGRGWHLYYQQPAGEQLGNSVARLGPGIDTRGHGGYVLAPPTTHPTGRSYLWHRPGTPVLPAPAWLVEQLATPTGDRQHTQPAGPPAPSAGMTQRGHAYLTRAVERELQAVMDALPGTRNDTLVRAAYSLGQLVGGGQLQHAAVAAALSAAASAAGLGEREADATIRSGLTAGHDNPRSAPQ